MPSLTFYCKFFISELCNTWSSDSSRPCYCYWCTITISVCDICSSSLSLSFESLDSIIISNFFITAFKMEDQRGIIIEERGKTIDIIFIDTKQDGGRKNISKYN